jgi:hypothetical protein
MTPGPKPVAAARKIHRLLAEQDIQINWKII